MQRAQPKVGDGHHEVVERHEADEQDAGDVKRVGLAAKQVKSFG